jgi:hypothetical protein
LNYWAYWVGETRSVQVDDDFMLDSNMSSWIGDGLFEHLASRLVIGGDQTPLVVHTLWQLLVARPALLGQRPDLRERTKHAVHDLLDCDDSAHPVRQQLCEILYAIKVASR